MTEKKNNGSSPDLDELLKQLGEETPDMPPDFHNRWMEAIRKEGRGKSDTGTENKRKGSAQWIRLAGVAAVMVFLIGGTLLSRDSFRTGSVSGNGSSVPDAISVKKQNHLQMTEEADAAAGSREEETEEEDMAEQVPEPAEELSAETMGLYAAWDAGAMEEAGEAACEEDALPEEAAEYDAAALPGLTEIPADAGEQEEQTLSASEESFEESGEKEEAGKDDQNAGQGEGNLTVFLRDLWQFARKTWPILAAVAVLWIAAEFRIRKRTSTGQRQ